MQASMFKSNPNEMVCLCKEYLSFITHLKQPGPKCLIIVLLVIIYEPMPEALRQPPFTKRI